jgi:hypothetical protein
MSNCPSVLPSVRVEPKNGVTTIDYDPQKPPRVFFDTNVILGLGKSGEAALQRLKYERGYRYRYSMLSFVELASHLADTPSQASQNPFRKYRAAFRRLNTLFNGPLPSAESILMSGIGLPECTGKNWIVDDKSIRSQVKSIAEAQSLEDLRKAGINPEHYKKLRAIDGQSFLELMGIARKTIRNPRDDVQAGGKFLRFVQSFLVFRASSEAVRLEKLLDEQRLRAIAFFDGPGGNMFLSHLLKVVIKAVRDGAKDDANDFYDMMQLLLLKDTNLLFVTDDRPFFQYYAGAEHHRVVPWKGFKDS